MHALLDLNLKGKFSLSLKFEVRAFYIRIVSVAENCRSTQGDSGSTIDYNSSQKNC